MVRKIRIPDRKRRPRRHISLALVLVVLCGSAVLSMLDTTANTPPPIEQPPAQQQMEESMIINVYDVDTKQLMLLGLEEYLTGVVAAEMPASFELEALKAQAVAARTYAINRIAQTPTKVTDLHSQAQITTSPAICQAWISVQEQKKRWGDNYTLYSEKIAQAVQQTQGKIITYNGTPIDPLYHASCGGQSTESAVHVWGNDYPYLVSVACNHQTDPHQNNQTTLSLTQFAKELGIKQAIPASIGTNSDYIKITSRTDSQRVHQMSIAGTTYSGTKIRSLLGLKSTQFQYNIKDGAITITTNGYGHGVGLCQYGANYYAQQGYTYQQILQHYYTGTQIQ